MHLPQEGNDTPPAPADEHCRAESDPKTSPPPCLPSPGDNASPSPCGKDDPAANAELLELTQAGPRSANLAAALTFFALIVIVGAVAWFHFSNNNGGYPVLLRHELRSDATIAASSLTRGVGVAVAPSWPLGLYDRLRRDILLYAAVAVVAAWLWSMAVRARARRDAFVVYKQLNDEITQLRASIEALKNSGGNDCGNGE